MNSTIVRPVLTAIVFGMCLSVSKANTDHHEVRYKGQTFTPVVLAGKYYSDFRNFIH